jgi:hypothetical protein
MLAHAASQVLKEQNSLELVLLWVSLRILLWVLLRVSLTRFFSQLLLGGPFSCLWIPSSEPLS